MVLLNSEAFYRSRKGYLHFHEKLLEIERGEIICPPERMMEGQWAVNYTDTQRFLNTFSSKLENYGKCTYEVSLFSSIPQLIVNCLIQKRFLLKLQIYATWPIPCWVSCHQTSCPPGGQRLLLLHRYAQTCRKFTLFRFFSSSSKFMYVKVLRKSLTN